MVARYFADSTVWIQKLSTVATAAASRAARQRNVADVVDPASSGLACGADVDGILIIATPQRVAAHTTPSGRVVGSDVSEAQHQTAWNLPA